jgi:thiamine-phosphate pyrophosphorylase
MTSSRFRGSLHGLYVILDPSVYPARLLRDVLVQSAAAGAKIFQYRNKMASMKEAYADALVLRKAAEQTGVLFIINDRCDLALAVDADGVHLGQDDLPIEHARAVMGPDKLLGLSTHNVDQVKEANRLKPDYIGFGPIFTPGSKQDHDPVVGLEGLRRVRPLTTLPMFAIGGINVDQVRAIRQAGAEGIAVISAVLKATDVKQAVRDLIARMNRSTSPAS